MAIPRKVGSLLIRYVRPLLFPLLFPLLSMFAAACLVVSILLSPTNAVAASQTQIKDKAADLARIKSKIGNVAQALAADRGRQGHLRAQVESSERKLRDGRAQLAEVDAKLKAQDAKLAQAQAQHAAAQAQLNIQRAALAGQLRSAYMLGSSNRLQLLLSAQDPGLTGRMLGYYGYLGRARADSIAQVNQQIKQVAALEQTIGDEHDRLEDLRKRRVATVADLRDDQQARTQAVNKLKARIADRSGELQHLRASEQQVEKLLDSLKTVLSSEPYDLGNHTAFAKLKGRLPWPLRGALLARFGTEKAGGPLQWRGDWIAAPSGAPVHASARGRVVYVGWISSYGLIVLLQHDHNYFTLYGHTAAANVTVGHTVDAGEVIAQAGDTGGYERSGVYFEVRHGSQALDPGDWLAK